MFHSGGTIQSSTGVPEGISTTFREIYRFRISSVRRTPFPVMLRQIGKSSAISAIMAGPSSAKAIVGRSPAELQFLAMTARSFFDIDGPFRATVMRTHGPVLPNLSTSTRFEPLGLPVCRFLNGLHSEQWPHKPQRPHDTKVDGRRAQEGCEDGDDEAGKRRHARLQQPVDCDDHHGLVQ